MAISKKTVGKMWRTFTVNNNQLDQELNRYTADGRTIYTMYPSSNIMGAVVVVTYTEE